jgi:hypothetical protein
VTTISCICSAAACWSAGAAAACGAAAGAFAAEAVLHRVIALQAGDMPAGRRFAGREDLDARLLREADDALRGGLGRHIEGADAALRGSGRGNRGRAGDGKRRHGNVGSGNMRKEAHQTFSP